MWIPTYIKPIKDDWKLTIGDVVDTLIGDGVSANVDTDNGFIDGGSDE